MGSNVSSRRAQRSDIRSRDSPSAQNQPSVNKDSKNDDKRTKTSERKAHQAKKSPSISVEGENLQPSDHSDVPADQKGFFYIERTPDGKKNKAGPFNLDEMKQFLQEEKLDDFTMVWHKSFGNVWKHLADIPSLKQQQLDEVLPHVLSLDLPPENYDEALLIASRDGDIETLTHLVRLCKEKVTVRFDLV